MTKVSNNKIIFKFAFLVLLVIYIYMFAVSLQSNVSNMNSIIIKYKDYVLIMMFIIFGIITKNEYKDNKSFKNVFLNNIKPYYPIYLFEYLLFLFIGGFYFTNLHLIPIEIFNLQPFFSIFNYGSFYNTIWLASYFLIFSLTPTLINKYLIINKKYRKQFYAVAIVLLSYLYSNSNLVNNLPFCFLLFYMGYTFDYLENEVKLKFNNNYMIIIATVIIPLILFIVKFKFSFLRYIVILFILLLLLFLNYYNEKRNYKFKNISKYINKMWEFAIPTLLFTFIFALNNNYLFKFMVTTIKHGRIIILYILLILLCFLFSKTKNFIISMMNKIEKINYKRYVYIFISIIVFSIVLGKISEINQNKGQSQEVIVLTLNNKNEMIDVNNYVLSGETNLETMELYINNKKISNIDVKDGKYEYKIDPSKLIEGWNYIEFVGYQNNNEIGVHCGGALNYLVDIPSVYVPDEYVKKARYMNKAHRDKYTLDDNYDYNKIYIGEKSLSEGEKLYMDNNGIPRVMYNKVLYYNPVFISGHALGVYSDYLHNKKGSDKKEFLKLADWFVNNHINGALIYPIIWPTGNVILDADWASAMAQGRALSVLARAYYLSKNEKYLKAGSIILNYMVKSGDKDVKNGTSKTLYDFTNKYPQLQKYNNYRIFEEYVTTPSSYTLNGDLYALLGLYDWYRVAPKKYGKEIARKAFDDGIKSVEVLLPYYDYYGWSSYDLMQYTNDAIPHVGNRYAHRVHLQLLYIVYTKTKSEKIKYYVDRFLSYYEDDFWIQSDVMYKEIASDKE